KRAVEDGCGLVHDVGGLIVSVTTTHDVGETSSRTVLVESTVAHVDGTSLLAVRSAMGAAAHVNGSTEATRIIASNAASVDDDGAPLFVSGSVVSDAT